MDLAVAWNVGADDTLSICGVPERSVTTDENEDVTGMLVSSVFPALPVLEIVVIRLEVVG